MAKKSKRENVWLECKDCGQRNYRTNISVAEGTPKAGVEEVLQVRTKAYGSQAEAEIKRVWCN